MEIPILYGERLRLRPMEAADDAALYALRSEPEVVRHSGVALYTGIGQAREYLARVLPGAPTGQALLWALVPAGQQAMAGGICLWNPAPDKLEYDIGYELAPAWQGRGLMSEAVRLVARYAFETLGLRRIWADPSAGNAASIALLMRCGFAFVREADGHRVYALEKS